MQKSTKLMKFNIDDLVNSFETKSKKDKDIFNDFLYHCYLSFDKTINSKKHKRKSDKYSIIRQKLINYLIANQNHVMMKLSKN